MDPKHRMLREENQTQKATPCVVCGCETSRTGTSTDRKGLEVGGRGPPHTLPGPVIAPQQGRAEPGSEYRLCYLSALGPWELILPLRAPISSLKKGRSNYPPPRTFLTKCGRCTSYVLGTMTFMRQQGQALGSGSGVGLHPTSVPSSLCDIEQVTSPSLGLGFLLLSQKGRVVARGWYENSMCSL